MKNVALIVAAGKGERAGGGVPKQFAIVAGKPMICHSVDAFLDFEAIDAVFVVIGADQDAMLANALAERKVSGVITGGQERQDSVRAGLDAIAVAGGAQNVLIHDAARPFVPASVVDRLLEALEQGPAAVPTLPVVDTLAAFGAELGDVVDRSKLARVQTPQAFHFEPILAAHRAWSGPPATDDAQIARAAGMTVNVVDGDAMLDKVTHAADFALAEARRASTLISRTGMGYDVHRLEAGEELWLCGVKIDHDKGLAGHSDADVALHALTDAVLGAIGDGDIGSHFPPSDPQWRGAASSRFLQHARDLVVARGGIIDHVDLTIICEAPKIGPHRDRMRAIVAELLQLPLDRVSIKATTTERLGFTGREEGIAAQALATVRL
jgi:2-C-methyl-D-erythritol 4-phosphate cytidylyltransferase / 2-C-methyl-D-erythritol 2,4-cyclodiphosphate synthase